MKNMQESARTLSASEARNNFSKLVSEAKYQGKIFIITRYGRPVAALVPFEFSQQFQKRKKR